MQSTRQFYLGLAMLSASLLGLAFGSGWWAGKRTELTLAGKDAQRLESMFELQDVQDARIAEKGRQIDAAERAITALTVQVKANEDQRRADNIILREDIQDVRQDIRQLRSLIAAKHPKGQAHAIITRRMDCP